MTESYLTPPAPDNRLLLALLSPFQDEITWSLSRLIHASFFYPRNLLLSEWLGLADRLLTFVDRLNKAARGQPYDTDGPNRVAACDDAFGDDADEDDYDSDSDAGYAIATGSAARPRRFDPRTNDDDYFVLNAAISASLILRNASDIEANAHWISKLQGVMRVAAEAVALPEEIYGFEGDNVRGADLDASLPSSSHSHEPEEQMRLEGIREMRLYWVEIAQTLASRIRIYSRAPIVRFEDGSVRRIPADALDVAAAAAAVAKAALEDEDEEEMADNFTVPTGAQRLHSSDRLYSHMVLLFHTTADRALLLAVMRFLANLIASSKSKTEIFVERRAAQTNPEPLEGLSPGIISRAKELLPLCDFDDQLAEVLLDCLDASVSIAVDRPDPTAPAVLAPLDDEGENEQQLRKEWPNALKLVAANNRHLSARLTAPLSSTSDASASRQALPLSQPTAALLVRLLTHKITSWPRQHVMSFSPVSQPLLRFIPSAQSHARDSLGKDPVEVEAAARWKRLREMKAESGLVEYTTSSEKHRLKNLEEPARVHEWLKLVTRVNTAPDASAYITQMQIWTSYRDTFEPFIKASQQRAMQDGSKPLAPLMPAADVISAVTASLQGTSAVLRPEEDRRIGGQKFVIAGLEGSLRPEVKRYNCRWRGCPQPNVDTSQSQQEHIRAHVGHSKVPHRTLNCQWGVCTYQLPVSGDNASSKGEEDRKAMVAHVQTHLPTEADGSRESNAPGEKSASVKQPPPPLLAPGQGRSVPLTVPKTEEAGVSPSVRNPHLQDDGVRALSAPAPSPGTVDRPSQINFHVYRTPFDPARDEPYGPAFAATRILASIARMCHTVLGDEGSEEDEDGEGGANGGKRVKLDFSDLAESAKFGMPFTLPANFQATVPPVTASASAMATPGEGVAAADANAGANANAADVSVSSALGAAATEAVQQKEEADVRAEAFVALHELVGIEDDMVKWAGCNDILTPTLMESLQHLSRIKGAKGRRRGGRKPSFATSGPVRAR
ncbi:unnamed protein product [Parajaminaea phylloscopi]